VSVLDRYIIKSLLINFLIAMGVMMSLYVVLDMFVNMDEFTEHGRPAHVVMRDIASYYGPNVLLYFKQLSGVIALFACLVTIARMRRQNELTAVLASGVSLYRVAAPIVVFGLATSGLLILDTEVLIPSVAHLLSREHDDVGDPTSQEVLFLPDRGNALLSAGAFDPEAGELRRMLVIQRNDRGDWTRILQADIGVWEQPDLVNPLGRWRLQRARVKYVVSGAPGGMVPESEIEEESPRHYESNLSPEAIQVRQAEGWVRFMSLTQLRTLKNKGGQLVSEIVRAKHQRIAAPIISMVLLLLGLPFFLDRAPENVLGDTGKCMIACGLCFAATFVSQSLKPAALPALPYWIPIFVFLTIATVLIDRIRT